MADPAGRVKESGSEIDFVETRAEQMRTILLVGTEANTAAGHAQ